MDLGGTEVGGGMGGKCDQNTLYIMYVCMKFSKYKIYVKISPS